MDMTLDSRVTLVRRWFEEVWNQTRFEILDEIATPDITYLSMLGAPVEGLESLRLYTSITRLAYPDLQVTIQSIELLGDRAVASVSVDGWITRLPEGFPPVSEEVHGHFLVSFLFKEGRIAQVRMLPEAGITPNWSSDQPIVPPRFGY